MRALNRCELIGRLGADPEIRYTQSGVAVCTLSIATNEAWTDKQTGESREETQWHRAVCWQRLAEIAAQYLQKGSRVYVSGPVKYRKWTDQAGIERIQAELAAKDLLMLDGQGQAQQPQQGQRPPQQHSRGNGQSRPPQQQRGAPDHQAPPPGPPAGEYFDDDIPF